MRRVLSLLWWCAGVVCLACIACAPSAAASRVIRVAVSDEEGHPVTRVAVEIDGLTAIRTDGDGAARISLGAEGAPRARIGVRCPEKTLEAAPRFVLRAGPGAEGPLQLSFVCRPALRKVVVVVRAPGGEGVWLRANGVPIGPIAGDGTLHAILERPPDSDLRLQLDTAGRALQPQNPALDLRVSDREELVVFDQPLALIKERSIRRRRVRDASPSPGVDLAPGADR